LQHPAQARLEIEDLQHLLLLVDLDVQVRGDEVGQLAGLGHAVDQGAGLLGQLGHELDDPLGDVLQVHHQRVQLDGRSGGIGQRLHPGGHERLLPGDLQQADARDPLQDDREVVLGELDHLEDARGAAHGVEVGGAGILGLGVALGDDADDRPFLGDGFLDQLDRFLPAHVDGDDRPGEEHRVTQRQDGDVLGNLDRTFGRRLLGGHQDQRNTHPPEVRQVSGRIRW
jgi:hypothetical protein